MSPKRGARIFTRPGGQGSSAGGEGAGAVVVWGPNFGESTELKQESRVDLVSQQQTYPMTQEALISAVEQTNFHDFEQEASVDNLDHEMAFPMTAESQVSGAEVFLDRPIASKDSFVGTAQTLGNCEDTANHDGQSLFVSGSSVLAQNMDVAFIGFDLSGLSSSYTVTSASLVLRPTGTPIGNSTGRTITFRGVANEAWAENTLVCSNAPAAAGPTVTAALTTGNTDTAVNVTNFATAITNQLGSTSFSFRLGYNALGDGWACHDKGSAGGASDTLGPRLRLRLSL